MKSLLNTLTLTVAVLGLVACGGSSASGPHHPSAVISKPLQPMDSFSAAANGLPPWDGSTVHVGDSVQLVVDFHAVKIDGVVYGDVATATVDHGIGTVLSGVPFSTPPLTAPETTYTVTVLNGSDPSQGGPAAVTSSVTLKTTDGPILHQLYAIENQSPVLLPTNVLVAPYGAVYAFLTPYDLVTEGSTGVSWLGYAVDADMVSFVGPDGHQGGILYDAKPRVGLQYTAASSSTFYATTTAAPVPGPLNRHGVWTLTATTNATGSHPVITKTWTITR